MKILFATWDAYELDEKNYTSYQARDEEHSFELIEKEKIDVIIFEEKFVQKMPWREFFLKVRTRFPHTRMLAIWEKESANDLNFLYSWMAFDVLMKEDCTKKALSYRVKRSRMFSDISHIFQTITSNNSFFQKTENGEKTLKNYDWLKKNGWFLIREMLDEDVYYYFEEKKVEVKLIIPFRNEPWERKIKVESKGKIPQSLQVDMEEVKNIFEQQTRLRKLLIKKNT